MPSSRFTRAAVGSAVAVGLGLVLLVRAAGGGGSEQAATTIPTTAATPSTTTSTAEIPTTTTPLPSTTTTAASPTTTTGVEAGVDPCALITPVDIVAALEVTVRPGLPSGEGGVSLCRFGGIDPPITVSVALHHPVGDLLSATRAGDPRATDYPGVGDGAVLQIETGQITVQVGDTGVVITVMAPPSEAALVELATTAAGRL